MCDKLGRFKWWKMKIENTKKVSLARCSLQRVCVEDIFFLVGQQSRRISLYTIDYGIWYIYALCFYNSFFIVFQEINTCTLYNVDCKEEGEFKKNTFAIFSRWIILYEGPKNDFQSWVVRFYDVKLCLYL